jgi:hypothetical protein
VWQSGQVTFSSAGLIMHWHMGQSGLSIASFLLEEPDTG